MPSAKGKRAADRTKKTLDNLKKSFGANVISSASDCLIAKNVITTGHKSLDEAIGIGGIPLGILIELYGPEASGKGVLSMSICSESQKGGLKTLWVDAEHQCNPDWMRTNGIDLEKIDMMDAYLSAEEILESIEQVVLAGIYQVIVIDSLASLIPAIEMEKNIGESQVGRMGAIMSTACRKLTQACAKNNCTIIFVNQTRDKIGVMFGNPETTPGGRSLKFFSSLRMRISKTSEKINKDGNQIGIWSKVKIVKNRFGIPQKEAMIPVYFMEYNPSPIEKFMDFGKNVAVIRKHQGENFKFASCIAETVLDLAPVMVENDMMGTFAARIKKSCEKKGIDIAKQDSDIAKIMEAIQNESFKLEDFV